MAARARSSLRSAAKFAQRPLTSAEVVPPFNYTSSKLDVGLPLFPFIFTNRIFSANNRFRHTLSMGAKVSSIPPTSPGSSALPHRLAKCGVLLVAGASKASMTVYNTQQLNNGLTTGHGLELRMAQAPGRKVRRLLTPQPTMPGYRVNFNSLRASHK